MTQPIVPDDAQGSVLFPEYATLYDLVAREVEGLTEDQLDFRSDQWSWSGWSIRHQLSHMAFAIYYWLLVRWGETLFPEGDHGVEDVEGVTNKGMLDDQRVLDVNRYGDKAVILHKLKEAIELSQRVLDERSVGFLRTHTHRREAPGLHLLAKAHPTGISLIEAPNTLEFTLEAIMRHLYFETTTHLYNIQRLKRAQGLPTVVEIPRVGYWTLDEWDRSEP